MTPRGRTPRTTHPATRWPAGLTALLAGLAGIAAFVQRPARAERVADSCPLNVGQKVTAATAFKGFAPIFREPRCINCHGAVNPFAENGGHPGGHIDIREEAREWLSRNPGILPAPNAFDQQQLSKELPRIRQVAESQQPITDNDFIRANAHEPMRAACKECHIDAWIIPLKKNQFVGRTDEELCDHLKTSDQTSPADLFLQHMQQDELIRVAFEGTRGLESAVTPQRPAMPFATLEKFVNAWVGAMGGKFHEPPDCGCVMPKFKLQVHHTWVLEVPGGFPSRQASEALFEVSLRPVGDERPGYLQGEFSLDRRIDMTLPAFCKGTASVKESWQFYATVDSASGSVRVWRTQISELPTGQIECKSGRGTARMGIDPGVLAGVLGAGELVIPADSTSKRVQASLEATRESLTITLLEVPPTK